MPATFSVKNYLAHGHSVIAKIIYFTEDNYLQSDVMYAYSSSNVPCDQRLCDKICTLTNI